MALTTHYLLLLFSPSLLAYSCLTPSLQEKEEEKLLVFLRSLSLSLRRILGSISIPTSFLPQSPTVALHYLLFLLQSLYNCLTIFQQKEEGEIF